MSFLTYHHGTRLAESNEVPVLVQVAQSAIVALIGTAPAANADAFPLNTPVLLKGSPVAAADLGDTGTLKDAVDDVFDQVGAYTIIVRVEEGADLAATLVNVVGDATLATGVHALKRAEALTGVVPRIIAAPGFTTGDGVTANPVVAELPAILETLEAVAFVDGPDTTDADAVAYRGLIGSERIYIVDQKVQVYDAETAAFVSRPASARFAGVQARVDLDLGFWHSLSNKDINGIGGVSRPVVYPAQTNLLNGNEVGCIINRGAGFKTWGNRGCGDESLWAFLSVRRTADFINDAIRRAYFEFVDKPFSAANLKLMLESGNAAMRSFQASGAIIGGKVWIDEARNQPEDLAAGKITLSMDFEPPAPMEDIRFLAHRNIEYYLDVTRDAISAAAA